jgi:very-long-chain enoyl-CoA reductase
MTDVLVAGMQMGYKLVFVIEYLGPLLFHPLFYFLRPYISIPFFYVDTAKRPTTDVQQLLFLVFMAHFLKRELETIFLHKFSNASMPAFNIFRNSSHYWLSYGLVAAFNNNATWSPLRYPMEQRSGLGPLDYFGLGVFVVCEVCNFVVHVHLAGLRKPGGTERGIPNTIGSSLVTAPNYMFETIAWVGILLISRDVALVLGIYFGVIYMRGWAKGKERTLRQLFPDRYKKKKYLMLPGLI